MSGFSRRLCQHDMSLKRQSTFGDEPERDGLASPEERLRRVRAACDANGMLDCRSRMMRVFAAVGPVDRGLRVYQESGSSQHVKAGEGR